MHNDATPDGEFTEGFCRTPACNSESSWLLGWESVFPDLRNRKLYAEPDVGGHTGNGLGVKGECRRQSYHRNMAAMSTDDRHGREGESEEDDTVTAEYLWGAATSEWNK